MPRRIFGPGTQFIQVRAADLRIALLEPFFVGDGCFLDKFDVRGTPASFIAVQKRFVGVAGDDVMQRIRKLHRIVNAAVQSQAADGIIDMGGITREKCAAYAKLRSDTLMCLIQVAMNEIVRFHFWKSALDPAVNGSVAKRMLVGFIDPSRKADAPSSLSIISSNLE